MSFPSADFPEIKWSLATLLLSAVLAAGLITYIANYQEQKFKEQQSAQQQLTEALNHLSAAQNDLKNMTVYQLEYESLQSQKVIGNEPRLDWIEGLEKLRRQGHVLDFTYTIAPQHAYPTHPPLEAGNFALNLSLMTLQLNLLHEEQLLRLLSAMHNEIPGWFILDRCSLSATESPGAGSGSLKAECVGGWLTMKNRNAP